MDHPQLLRADLDVKEFECLIHGLHTAKTYFNSQGLSDNADQLSALIDKLLVPPSERPQKETEDSR